MTKGLGEMVTAIGRQITLSRKAKAQVQRPIYFSLNDEMWFLQTQERKKMKKEWSNDFKRRSDAAEGSVKQTRMQ